MKRLDFSVWNDLYTKKKTGINREQCNKNFLYIRGNTKIIHFGDLEKPTEDYKIEALVLHHELEVTASSKSSSQIPAQVFLAVCLGLPARSFPCTPHQSVLLLS